MINSDYALRGRNLSFSFAEVPVLHGVDIELPWGSLTAIAGPNGAGKSTLLEILAGVRQSLTGSVERADEVALVVQRVSAPDTLPLTVREVVAMGTWGVARRGSARGSTELSAKERKARVAGALERVQLADLAAAPFNALSGGQRQRTLLAQGIARRARIFLLDEPAAGLDAESRNRTRAMLAEEARRGAAVACVSHDEDAIADADFVIRLESGRRLSAQLSPHSR
ncbi:ABC transporter ATP-binding protein [Arthrobacter psychrolactophilus]|uniref:ABC transporter ATP-binding protein n=1 Tax=Arthrobacter psychrolactophilus TaxID=92442 RepID=A0A2V5JMM3_9MICC|nr:ATP-binding cassette domain-containing protein [Arthrobacter psychrolactophilus]PYI39396.1 ABC transporter ATP-binding protein [Arthrobacter psychrolactophilus]